MKWRRVPSLRARLFLLVVASVVPLVGMWVVREDPDYAAEREAIFDGLIGTARGVAAVVERDLQLRVSSLETLATSPALLEDDLSRFDPQALAFLARLPTGTVLGLSSPDGQLRRVYDASGVSFANLPRRDAGARQLQIFASGQSIVTDLHVGRRTGTLGFTVDVPVVRDSQVAYDLFIRLAPGVMGDLIQHQYVPTRTVLSVADASGHVVARTPNGDRFTGVAVAPALWAEVQAHREGITRAPTLEGTPAVAAYAHIPQFDWTVVVGAPQEVVFAPMRAAIIRVAGAGAMVLLAGLALAMLAARGITRPIEQLRRLAVHDDRIDPTGTLKTGLPETDVVARALETAAAERQASARALAESETRFRALFEKSASGMLLLDPETTRVIDSNEVAAATVGYSVEEMRAHAITDFALQTSAHKIRTICRSVVADGPSVRYETRI